MDSPQRQTDMSHRTGCLIPPLPKTKLLRETNAKTRSPLKPKGGGRHPFRREEEHQSTSISPQFLPQRSRVDKERDRTKNQGVLAPLPFSSNTGLAAHRSSAATRDKENVQTILPSCSRRTTKTSSRVQSRHRETADSVFGLSNHSSDEYRQLCRNVADGRCDDAGSWRRLLELAQKQVNLNASPQTNERKDQVAF